jgi:hypothetical protein
MMRRMCRKRHIATNTTQPTTHIANGSEMMSHLNANREMFCEMEAMEGGKESVYICRLDRQPDLFLELQPELVLTPGARSL